MCATKPIAKFGGGVTRVAVEQVRPVGIKSDPVIRMESGSHPVKTDQARLRFEVKDTVGLIRPPDGSVGYGVLPVAHMGDGLGCTEPTAAFQQFSLASGQLMLELAVPQQRGEIAQQDQAAKDRQPGEQPGDQAWLAKPLDFFGVQR